MNASPSLLSRRRPKPPPMPPHMPIQRKFCMMSAITIEKNAATVITSMSRLITCVSSWAITPSSSGSLSWLRMPLVTATTA